MYQVAKPKRSVKQRRAMSGPNEPEMKFRNLAEEKGWSCSKRGWPDFVCEDEDGIFFVEVKPTLSSRLKPTQHRVMVALVQAGFRCYVWNPETGFRQMKFSPVVPSGKPTVYQRRKRKKKEVKQYTIMGQR
jgi:hypothetical protein